MASLFKGAKMARTMKKWHDPGSYPVYFLCGLGGAICSYYCFRLAVLAPETKVSRDRRQQQLEENHGMGNNFYHHGLRALGPGYTRMQVSQPINKVLNKITGNGDMPDVHTALRDEHGELLQLPDVAKHKAKGPEKPLGSN